MGRLLLLAFLWLATADGQRWSVRHSWGSACAPSHLQLPLLCFSADVHFLVGASDTSALPEMLEGLAPRPGSGQSVEAVRSPDVPEVLAPDMNGEASCSSSGMGGAGP